MKIAIITVYQPFTNLGSFLQAYALKKYLEQQGHQVSFVKTSSHLRSVIKQVSKLRPYRSYFLRITKAFHALSDLNKLSYIDYNDSSIDCYIWGSDEIWNVTNQFFCRPLFWGVGINEKPKIGYAISAGHATKDDFISNTNLTSKASSFNKIFVRDHHTKQLLKECCAVSASLVIDPTLLVSADKLSIKIKIPDKKYLLVYTYGIDNRMIEIVKKFASKNNLQIVSPCFWHLWADKTIECSALQFSSLIANAEYVFTTTFHGAIFSLINHSRCCILPMRPKVRDLCETLNSEDRLISKNCTLEEFENIITKPFAVDEFELNLEKLRDFSSKLLLQELNHIADEKID